MKKLFSIIGFVTILSLSFIISKQTETVVKNIDTIMTEIKENQNKYDINPIPAIIENDTIIPGINGKKLNIEKTYTEMKKIGKYNEKYLIFDEIRPDKTLENQYDKYIISGNKNKNQISLIFIIEENDNITTIKKILDKTNTKATFFINQKWLDKNRDTALKLVKENHTIGMLSKQTNNEISPISIILKDAGKQKNNYCYTRIKKEEIIKECSLQKKYTIMPSIVIKNSPLSEIKRQIKPGALIELTITNKVNNELELIIKYIKTKGYEIENLENHLSEKNSN